MILLNILNLDKMKPLWFSIEKFYHLYIEAIMFSSDNTEPINSNGSIPHNTHLSSNYSNQQPELTSFNKKGHHQGPFTYKIPIIFSALFPVKVVYSSKTIQRNTSYIRTNYQLSLDETPKAINATRVKIELEMQQCNTINKVQNNVPETVFPIKAEHTQNYINTIYTAQADCLQVSSLPDTAAIPLSIQTQLKRNETKQNTYSEIDIGLKSYQPGLYSKAYYDHIYFSALDLKSS